MHFNLSVFYFSKGDPAIDYIGTGGAEYLPESSIIPGMDKCY